MARATQESQTRQEPWINSCHEVRTTPQYNRATVLRCVELVVELDKSFAESKQIFAELDKSFARSNQIFAECKQIFAESKQRSAECDKELAEYDKELAELDKQLEGLDESLERCDQIIAESKQVIADYRARKSLLAKKTSNNPIHEFVSYLSHPQN
jgi:chromosome segregation ATPase